MGARDRLMLRIAAAAVALTAETVRFLTVRGPRSGDMRMSGLKYQSPFAGRDEV